MASSAELSTLVVVNAIQSLTVEETKDLVFQLGVPLNELDDITARYGGSDCKRHLIQKWLDDDTLASWTRLVSGLQQIKKSVSAEKIESTDIVAIPTKARTAANLSNTAFPLPKPVTPPGSSPVALTPVSIQSFSLCIQPIQLPVLSQERVAEVKVSIEHFEDEFTNLKSDTRASLCYKQSQDQAFIDTFRDYLIDLPVTKKAIHVKFFLKNEDDIIEAKTIRKLFAILSRYCNYSNYEIVLHVANKFCEVALKKRMVSYRDSLTTFEKATTVDIYLCAIKAHPEGEICRGFTKMAMKINKPTSMCTLYEIRMLKERIAGNASVPSYCVYIGENIAKRSVLVCLRVHPACAEAVIAAVSSDFMKIHHLTEFFVNNRLVVQLGPTPTQQSHKEPIQEPLLTDSTTLPPPLPPKKKMAEGDDHTGDMESGSAKSILKSRQAVQASAEPIDALRGALHEDDDQGSSVDPPHLTREPQVKEPPPDAELLQRRSDKDKSQTAAKKESMAFSVITAVSQLVVPNVINPIVLMRAVSNGDKAKVEELLSHGADPNAFPIMIQFTPLMEASRLGNVEIAQLLLERGADPNLTNIENWTALMAAANNGRLGTADILLRKGANPDMQDHTGWSALMAAVYKDHHDVALRIIRAGATPHIQDHNHTNALLLAIAKHKDDTVVDALLECEPELDLQDSFGETALIFACKKKNLKLVNRLLSMGANPNIGNNDRETPVLIATGLGEKEILEELLEKHADPNKGKEPPLLVASNHGYEGIVDLLMEHGADPDKQDERGVTAFEVAEVRNFQDLANKLNPQQFSSRTPRDVYKLTKKSLASLQSHISRGPLFLNPDTKTEVTSLAWLRGVWQRLPIH